MATLWIVEALNVIEHAGLCIVLGLVEQSHVIPGMLARRPV